MKSVLIYGDSNTWGLIPGSDPAAQYPPEIRWTCRLQSMCPDVRFLTDGLCGRTIAHEDAERPGRSGMQTLPLLLERHDPLDAAVIMLGTNDCKAVFALTPQQIAQDMRASVRSASVRSRKPHPADRAAAARRGRVESRKRSRVQSAERAHLPCAYGGIPAGRTGLRNGVSGCGRSRHGKPCRRRASGSARRHPRATSRGQRGRSRCSP